MVAFTRSKSLKMRLTLKLSALLSGSEPMTQPKLSVKYVRLGILAVTKHLTLLVALIFITFIVIFFVKSPTFLASSRKFVYVLSMVTVLPVFENNFATGIWRF